MIRGMTGFGTAPVSAGKYKGLIEIKSQNHRYLDIVYYLPVGFSSYEDGIRQALSKILDRGRVTVVFKITDKPKQELIFNHEVVREYLRHARELAKEFKFKDHLNLSDMVRLPGVFEVKESKVEVDPFWPAFEKAFKKSLDSLVRMREREGKCLAAEFRDILKRMSLQIKMINARTAAILRQKKKEMANEEFLSFQKGNDIREEIARLEHYIQEFRLLIQADVPVGKKFDFVAQEMQRETNTIGSKVQDREISNGVIALKSKIEKLREQAQNIV
jgi:uncharacterized protein (TIGR00255 family)